jgi:hypothetical protein
MRRASDCSPVLAQARNSAPAKLPAPLTWHPSHASLLEVSAHATAPQLFCNHYLSPVFLVAQVAGLDQGIRSDEVRAGVTPLDVVMWVR